MVNKRLSSMFLAIGLIVGTVVGGGILGLPYIISKSGMTVGIINIVLVGIAATLMTLYVGELALRTRRKHQLAGFAEKYLGRKWKYVMLVVETFGIYTAIIAYLLGVGSALSGLFPALFSGSSFVWSVMFFVVFAPMVYMGIKTLSKVEMFITLAKMILLLGLSILIVPTVSHANIDFTFDASKIFVPFGIVLFSMLGYSVLPEIEEVMSRNKKNIKNVIIISMVLVGSFYLFYTYVFVGNFGSGVNEISMGSLTGKLGIFGGIFVLLTMTTPYMALSAVVKDVYTHDFNIKNKLAWFLAVSIPFIVLLFGNVSFTEMLLISGTYAGGLMGILSAWMVYKARKMKAETKPDYIVPGGTPLIVFTMLFFVAGIGYETFHLLGLF